MSIYTFLKKDHRDFEDLIHKIIMLSPDDITHRNELFNELKDKITVHSQAEEDVFYMPLTHHSETKEEAKHGKKEHQEVAEMLEKLASMSTKRQKVEWMTNFKEMANALLHHIREEETDLFSDAKKVLPMQAAKVMENKMKVEEMQLQQHLHNMPDSNKK